MAPERGQAGVVRAPDCLLNRKKLHVGFDEPRLVRGLFFGIDITFWVGQDWRWVTGIWASSRKKSGYFSFKKIDT